MTSESLSSAQALALPAAESRAEADDQEERRQVARARSGDSAAIDWLVERYRLRVVRLAAHTLRRPSEAEDVAQEAFVRAFSSLGRYRGDSRFYTWLYRIVVRICVDRQRTARWHEMPLEVIPSSGEPAPGDDADTRILVEELMDRLEPRQRALLVLREVDGLSYDEIAGVMGMSLADVRWRLQAARERFRKLWSASAKEAEDA